MPTASTRIFALLLIPALVSSIAAQGAQPRYGAPQYGSAQHGAGQYGAGQYGAAPSGATTTGVGMQWGADLNTAKAQAQQSGKLVLVHFWTPSCAPCKILDSQVFNQPTVAGPVQQKFVPVKINANAAQETAQALGINQVPTDVIMTPQGQVIAKFVSPASPMAYVSKLVNVAADHRARSGANFQLAAAQAPAGAKMNNAYANLAIPSAAPAPPTQQQPPLAQTPPQQTTNPYAADGRYGVAPQPPATPPTAGGPTGASPYGTMNNPYASAPSQPASQNSRRSTNSESAAVAAAAPQVPAPPAVGPQLPPGSPPIGFEGYCTVTMKREMAKNNGQGKWVKGDPKWGAIHFGRTYLFAGQGERDEFLKNPEIYSPVLSGVDPVLAIDQQQNAPGKREYSLEYQGKFYMFTSETTLKKFWSNPEGYARGVRQAMTPSTGPTYR